MRTILLIIVGLLLLSAMAGVVGLIWKDSPSAMRRAIRVFLGVWCLAATVNLWIGVMDAGYTFWEELPVFLLVVLVPTVTALFIQRKSSSPHDKE
jgi:hypothetical protein